VLEYKLTTPSALQFMLLSHRTVPYHRPIISYSTVSAHQLE